MATNTTWMSEDGSQYKQRFYPRVTDQGFIAEAIEVCADTHFLINAVKEAGGPRGELFLVWCRDRLEPGKAWSDTAVTLWNPFRRDHREGLEFCFAPKPPRGQLGFHNSLRLRPPIEVMGLGLFGRTIFFLPSLPLLFCFRSLLFLKPGFFFLFLPILLLLLLTRQTSSQHNRLSQGAVELGTTPTSPVPRHQVHVPMMEDDAEREDLWYLTEMVYSIRTPIRPIVLKSNLTGPQHPTAPSHDDSMAQICADTGTSDDGSDNSEETQMNQLPYERLRAQNMYLQGSQHQRKRGRQCRIRQGNGHQRTSEEKSGLNTISNPPPTR